MSDPTRLADALRRSLDISGALLGIVVLSPFLAILAFVLLAGQGRPLFYKDLRVGRGGVAFEVVKFRTMRPISEDGEAPQPDDERVTLLGKWLRSTSVDELPQLWSVLRGDMSLVGPRPLPLRYLGRYSPSELRRHEVRPGLTGLAQISGRNDVTWEARLDLDVWYVDHRTLRLDLKILFSTIPLVIPSKRAAARPAIMGELRPHLAEHETHDT